MQILSLTLEDIKSYNRATICFTAGTNAIVGQNGAGKSTILEAIGFALFDTLPYRQADFVREGAKSGTVTVGFHSSHDERAYDVVRRCGSSSQYYVFDPESEVRIVEGKADVQRFLRQHLGVDLNADLERLFRDAVGVLQGTLTAAFLDVASKRVGTFDPLLQVHDYDTAWTRLREPVRTLRARVQTLDVEIAGLRARLEQLPVLETAMARRTQELAAKQSQAQSLEQELAGIEQTLATLDSAAQTVTARTRAADQTASQLDSARQRLQHARDALAEAAEAATLVKQHTQGYAAYMAAQTRKRELDAQAGERSRWYDQRTSIETKIARLQAEIAASDQALAEVAAAKEELDALAGPARQQQELERALTAARAQAAQRDTVMQEIARGERELARLVERREMLEAARAAAIRLEQEQRVAETTVADLQHAIEGRVRVQQALETEADAVKKQTTELGATDQSTCPVCEQPLTDEHRTAMVARNESRLAALRADYRAAQDELAAARTALATAQTELAGLVEQRRELPRHQEIEAVDESVAAQEATLATLGRQRDELTASAERVAVLEMDLRALGDPGRRAAVAQAKVTRETDLVTQRAAQADQLEQTGKQLVRVQDELAQYADLDEEVRVTVDALSEHDAAYQIVLANRRMGEALPEREATVAVRRAEVATAEAAHEEAVAARDTALAQYDAQAHTDAKAQQMQQRSALASLQTELRLLQAQNSQDLDTIARLRAVDATLTEQVSLRERTADQADVLEHLRGVLKQAGPYIRRMVIQRISTEAAQIFGDLMQDHARHLTWSEDYEISLDVNGNTRQFAQLSGGEQMSAALAVRLALLRAMSNIDVAFFDEPTSNLDETRRSALAQQITQNHGLRQLFVISHDDTFEQATENLIRIVRTNGVSRVEE